MFMYELTTIQRMNVLYMELQAYTKRSQVYLTVKGDFKALYCELLFSEADRSCKVGGVCRGAIVFD